MLVCLIITLALPVTANAAVKINKTSVSVLRGKTYNLKITGTKKKIKWTSSNKKIATVSASGKIKGINKGKCNIYAKVGKKKYTCKVTVKQPVTSIKLSKKSISLNKGKKYTLKARIAPKNAANKAVVWKSSNTKIASVSSKGVVTAKSTGTTTITATAKDGSRKKASCKVTVKGSSNKKILIQELKFNKKEQKYLLYPDYVTNYINITTPETLLPEIIPANATNRTISWKSSNTNIATVGYDGKVTAKSVGTAIITASAVDGSKKSASYKVQVMGGNSNFMLVDMEKEENVRYIRQESSMTETQREEFLDAFREQDTPTVGFCVMGGIFSEGIDLQNEAVIGVIIVGTGLPQTGSRQEILKSHYEKEGKNGFLFAYLYPGMNKVLQAAGRLIRTSEDYGVIALLDERFLQGSYRSQFPPDWTDMNIVQLSNCTALLEQFWADIEQ